MVEQREMGIGTLVSYIVVCKYIQYIFDIDKKGVDLNCQLRTKMGTL